MHTRSLILMAALCAVVAAGVYHWRAKQDCARLDAEHALLAMKIADQRRLIEEESRQVAAAQAKPDTEIDERAKRLAASSEARASAAPANVTAASAPMPASKANAASVNSEELRAWQVQAFVSDQRLRFAALLKRLGFTAEELREFDRIQGGYHHAMLDAAPTDAARQAARLTRDEQLRTLFAGNHEEWLAANRNEPARALVNQIVQMTFQSSGALTTAQADELTRIVAQHRIQSVREGAGAGRPGYDWDRIAAAADDILAPQQREDFVAAIEFRRASEKMSALAAKRR